jgi:Glycosyl transferase family 2
MRATRPPAGPVEVSVVVVTLAGEQHLDRCLEQLTHSETGAGFEVIIPVDETLDHISTLEARYPAWRFLRTAGICSYAQLRSVGVKAATGRLVAITEDHCLPARNWIQRIIEAHAAAPVAIGGAVEINGTDDPLNLAVYFQDYLRYMPPVAAGAAIAPAMTNASYKRAALQEIASVWEPEFHATAVHDALATAGGELWLSPDILVRQCRDTGIEHALRERYAFGRLSGSRHAAAATSGMRALHALLSPARAPLQLIRLLPVILRKRRRGWQFLAALPALALLATAWACGECTGYVTCRAGPRLEPKPVPEFNP